ncbi:MAG: LytR C-terminal domain-containing protein [Actinobacteria bacterium]|nr:LytR C-terminal domain-containing protein [Actinomycetota bacterium]
MHHSIVRRCLLIGALPIALVACSSNTSNRAITTISFGRTTTVAATTDATLDATTTSGVSTTSPSTTTVETTTSTLPPLATTTTITLVTAGAVVKVANATEVENAAARVTDELAVAGFAVAEPTNGAGKDEALTVSKIYVLAGSEATAESVSYLMGDISISRMPTPAWIFGGTAALGDTTVLVMLGSDLAGVPLLSMRFEPGRQGPD